MMWFNSRMHRRRTGSYRLSVELLEDRATPAVGMAAHQFGSVMVFDPETSEVFGSVSLPDSHGASGDVAITPDGKMGFVTDFASRVWVIDLSRTLPRLAAGTNPIPISNYGEDLSLTPDGKYLVVSDGSAVQPLSVIDIAARSEVDTFSFGSDHDSVDVCDNGSVLSTSWNWLQVRRATIDSSGMLNDTGERTYVGGYVGRPINVYCAPGSRSGIVLGTSWIASFTTPGLDIIDVRAIGSSVVSGAFSPAGDRFYVTRGHDFGQLATLQAFAFDPATGELGDMPLYSVPANPNCCYFGIDQIAVSPDGAQVYVTAPFEIDVYDATTGTFIRHMDIEAPQAGHLTGVAVVAAASPPKIDVYLEPDEVDPAKTALVVVGTPAGNDAITLIADDNCDDSETTDAVEVAINGISQGVFTPNGRLVVYGRGGDDDIEIGSGLDLQAWLYGGAGNDRVRGGVGDDVVNGGTGNDLLEGNRGRDMLIGGSGSDYLIGDHGEDILIAGLTSLDADVAAIAAIMAEWTSDHGFSTRVNNLSGGPGAAPDRRNGDVFLSVRVSDDNAEDILTGAAGRDWFFARLDGSGADRITDPQAGFVTLLSDPGAG